MVDINLYKEEDKEWLSSKDENEPEKEDIAEKLSFEDDMSEPALDEDELLGDIGEEPKEDLTGEELPSDDDYAFDSKGKKAWVWLWLLLGLVCVAAAVYLFVINPDFLRFKKKTAGEPVKSAMITQDTASSAVPMPQDSAAIVSIPPSQAASLIEEVHFEDLVPTRILVDASRSVLEDLAGSGQFATLLIVADRYFVEYVSETPGVAQAMGRRIQTLLKAKSFKFSPEDQHMTEGESAYWGVISGRLDYQRAQGFPSGADQFKDVNTFISTVQGKSRQFKLAPRTSQKLTDQVSGGHREVCVRIEMEGSRENALSYLESLQSFQGNFGISKILVAPVKYSDFSAANIKLVLDFLIRI